MTETLPDPYGKGHDMLVEWGIWTRDDREGGASWSVRPRVDPTHGGEPPEFVFWLDKIIAKRKLKVHGDYGIIARYYLSDLTAWQIARERKWSENRVKGAIQAFCGLVEREWEDSRC